MTVEEVRAAIFADPALKEMAIKGQDGQIARTLPPDIKPKVFSLTSLGVLNIFGLTRGAKIMQDIRLSASADPELSEVIPHMDRDGLSLAPDDMRSMLQKWVSSNLIKKAEQDTLLELGQERVPVSIDLVNKALRPYRFEGKAGQKNWREEGGQ